MRIIILFVFYFMREISASPLKYDSIYIFGDSVSDTGNFLLSDAQSYPFVGGPPYGETFFHHATGRFSDGRLIIDFIAEASGLPYLPPYRSLSNGQIPKYGVNFAVSGATAIDTKYFYDKGTGPIFWTNDSLSVQLGWFKKIKPTLCSTKQDCDNRFKRSLFIMGEIGGNDLNFPFFAGATLEQARATVPLVVESIISATGMLIEEGATEIMVPGNFLIGCASVYLTLFQSPNKTDYDRNGCLKAYNGLSQYLNAQLKVALEKLRLKYPHARIIYVDYYSASKPLYYTPVNYGFSSGALKACCGGGGPYNYNNSIACGHSGSSVCENPSKYVSWDGLHLTEAAYQYIANRVINGPFTSPPLRSSPH